MKNSGNAKNFFIKQGSYRNSQQARKLASQYLSKITNLQERLANEEQKLKRLLRSSNVANL